MDAEDISRNGSTPPDIPDDEGPHYQFNPRMEEVAEFDDEGYITLRGWRWIGLVFCETNRVAALHGNAAAFDRAIDLLLMLSPEERDSRAFLMHVFFGFPDTDRLRDAPHFTRSTSPDHWLEFDLDAQREREHDDIYHEAAQWFALVEQETLAVLRSTPGISLYDAGIVTQRRLLDKHRWAVTTYSAIRWAIMQPRRDGTLLCPRCEGEPHDMRGNCELYEAWAERWKGHANYYERHVAPKIAALKAAGKWPHYQSEHGQTSGGADSANAQSEPGFAPHEAPKPSAIYTYRNRFDEPILEITEYADGYRETVRLSTRERVPLYRLPELLVADGNWILIVATEAEADKLVQAGLYATTRHEGLAKWERRDSLVLTDRRVAFVRDRENVKLEDTITPLLNQIGMLADDLRDLPLDVPVIDWLATHEVSDLIDMIEETPTGSRDFEQIERRPVRAVIEGILYEGKSAILEGDPEQFKTGVALDFAARISTGTAFMGQPVKQGRVLIFSNEDDPEDTLGPRLEAAGADLSQIRFVDPIKLPNGSIRNYVLPDDLHLVRLEVRRYQAAAMVFDPMSSFIGKNIDSHNDASVRVVMDNLSLLARQTGTAILCIRHLTKNSDTKNALYRGGGSIAFIGSVRTAFLIGKNPQNEDQQILTCVKNNCGPKIKSLAFEIVGPNPEAGETQPHAEWIEEWLDVTPNDVLAAATVVTKRRSQMTQAKEFILSYLQTGMLVPVTALDEASAKAGIAPGTHKRAKTDLAVRLFWKLVEGDNGDRRNRKWLVRLRTETEIAEKLEQMRRDGQEPKGL